MKRNPSTERQLRETLGVATELMTDVERKIALLRISDGTTADKSADEMQDLMLRLRRNLAEIERS